MQDAMNFGQVFLRHHRTETQRSSDAGESTVRLLLEVIESPDESRGYRLIFPQPQTSAADAGITMRRVVVLRGVSSALRAGRRDSITTGSRTDRPAQRHASRPRGKQIFTGMQDSRLYLRKAGFSLITPRTSYENGRCKGEDPSADKQSKALSIPQDATLRGLRTFSGVSACVKWRMHRL